MLRRHFLASAALAAAPGKVTVNAHPWVYAARQPGYDPTPILDQIFTEISQAGIDGIELMHPVLLHDEAVLAQVEELSRRNRLPVIGCSWSAAMWDASQHDSIVREAGTLLPRLARLKGRLLGTSVGDARRRKTPAELDAQAAVLRNVMRIARDNGVTVNLHNHVYEVANGEYDLSGTLERIPDARLGPDIGWLFRAKVDPADFIRRHKGRIVYAHLRNEKADGKWPESMEEGVIDFASVANALRETGFAGDLAIEIAHERGFQPTRPYGESIRLSRAYVRRVMGY
ncbi:MAG: sugar phosphate isomerase/epimerase [Bryobacterales bacterium]|nr:sugar phosphate isomerase/epimerase [Bryobacterales bacterium]